MIIKRDGSKVEFSVDRIINAINKAMTSAMGKEVFNQSLEVAEEIEKEYCELERDMTIYEIENKVHDKLCDKGNHATARAYIEYKELRAQKRLDNTIDKKLDGLFSLTDQEQIMENSNKNVELISTQRDLIAGEVSKDYMMRKIVPTNLVQAHNTGTIHIHDLSNLAPPSINCCLLDYKNMFDNGTVINGKLIEKPKSFKVACTVLSQVIAQISSGMHGLTKLPC